MMSFSSSIVCVIGCRRPVRTADAGQTGIEGGWLARGGFGRRQSLFGQLKSGFDPLLGLVQPLAGSRSVLPIDRSHQLLGFLEAAALGPQELHARRLQVLRVAGRAEGGFGLLGQGVKLLHEIGQGHHVHSTGRIDGWQAW